MEKKVFKSNFEICGEFASNVANMDDVCWKLYRAYCEDDMNVSTLKLNDEFGSLLVRMILDPAGENILYWSEYQHVCIYERKTSGDKCMRHIFEFEPYVNGLGIDAYKNPFLGIAKLQLDYILQNKITKNTNFVIKF